MVFQQRNGRVDRFGQRHRPRIDYLLTEAGEARIKGDLRVIEVLVGKDEQISRNIGDPASILRRHSIEESIQRAREQDRQGSAWPDIQYLWPQHPISQWLIDRVIGGVGRRRAPLILSPQLAPGEQAFLMLGLIPNRKGQPLIAEWKAVARRDGGAFDIQPFDDFCRRAGLRARGLPNRGQPLDLSDLQASLGAAVAAMQRFVETQVRHFSTARDQEVRQKLAQLDELRQAQERRLESRLDGLPDHLRQARKARRLKDIEDVFNEYGQWVKDSLEIEPVPHVQVLAAVASPA